MEAQLTEVNPTEYGIEKSKAKELTGNLPQIISERAELEKQFDKIIRLDIEDVETAGKARALRLLIVKNRTQGINEWHEKTKDYFLKGGQFVDAKKRKEVEVNERMERELMQMEKHAEIKEQKRLEALQQERAEKLSPYVEDAHERDLVKFAEDEFEALLSTKKKQHEDLIAAQKKAEEEAIAKAKAEAEEQKRIKAENEKLRKEAEERERAAEAVRQKQLEAEAARAKREEAAQKEREEKERKEREAHKAELRAERKKQDKLAAELKAKEEAEAKAAAEEKARIEAELKKGDAAKVNDLIADLDALKTKYSFKSKTNQKKYADVGVLIDRVIAHVNR